MNKAQVMMAMSGMHNIMQLPEEMILTILGFLDVRSLRTARLVCKQFRQSASGQLRSLELTIPDLALTSNTIFTQFSGLTRLSVTALWNQLQLVVNPRLAPLVTHVAFGPLVPDVDWNTPSLADFFRQSCHGQLALLTYLPKLRSLSLWADIHAVQVLPLGLEELHLRRYVPDDLSPFTRFSGLTSLGVAVTTGPESSFACLTRLVNLCLLELQCGFTPAGMLSMLTMLTGLNLELSWARRNTTPVYPDLAHLTGLSDLVLSDTSRLVRHEDLTCFSALTKLTRLDLECGGFASCAEGSSALLPLSRLVSLKLTCICGHNSPPPSLRVEALHSLALGGVQGDIAVLQMATRLTHLDFCPFRVPGGTLRELGPTLCRMSGLRDLRLSLAPAHACREELESRELFQLGPVLGALTSLTYLKYEGEFTAGTDLGACASLPGLRSLDLRGTREVTAACLPALQAMSGLTELTLRDTGIRDEHLTPEVRAGFDVERVRRGWPCLKLCVSTSPFRRYMEHACDALVPI